MNDHINQNTEKLQGIEHTIENYSNEVVTDSDENLDSQAAAIVNQATERSLVILDEIGRGTATYDGLSIAWATVEHLVTRLGCRCLFATHYHELTELEKDFSGVSNFNVAVREWEEKIVFLHKIVPGSADKSYGIHVARLAGVPGWVNRRAEQILEKLE